MTATFPVLYRERERGAEVGSYDPKLNECVDMATSRNPREKEKERERTIIYMMNGTAMA